VPDVLPPVSASLAGVVADATTTTSEAVPRIVGEPLPSWVVLAASAALFVAIVLAGLVVSRRMRAAGDR
jgi:hypothetical protein